MLDRPTAAAVKLPLPTKRDLYYGGAWNPPKRATYVETISPGNGMSLGQVADGSAADVDAAVQAAAEAFKTWRLVPPQERAQMLRRMAAILRDNARELALIDAADCGNPVSEMVRDGMAAAAQVEFFAGLVTEMKGHSIPMGPDSVNFSEREPRGVVGRIIPFNHPFMFCGGKAAAPLAAGNTIVIKPPEQAPLSALRLTELLEGVFPPGVFNLVPGGREAGAALASHPQVAMIAMIGSVPTGRAVMRAASDTLKPVLLELGGKNALIACADANPDEVAAAVVAGMNFTWCGQSCGSTSRAFLHADIHDAVVKRIPDQIKNYRPGDPTLDATTMGAIISQTQHAKILDFIGSAQSEGARLVTGGSAPKDPALGKGLFIEPTVFADVKQDMRIARQEIFGPVLSVLSWRDQRQMIADVNSVEYGLTCSIWTENLSLAHRLAADVQAGYVWINETSKHFLGAPFGGYKQSGMGREECLEELLAFTQEKNVHVSLRRNVSQ
jgi:betaine-aldehyde dehydrogenase